MATNASEPIWFVVRRHHGVESPAVFYDYLPPALTRKLPVDNKRRPIEQPPLVYMLRLDRADPGSWLKRPLAEVFDEYQALREIGALPPASTIDQPATDKPKGREIGPDYWRFTLALPWHGRAPDPFPQPGTIRSRSSAGAFVSESEL